MQTIGQLIREKRQAAGLSLRMVAERLDLSVPYLSDIELGHRRPITKRWRAFSEAIPGLTLRAMAEASLASGPVEIDVSTFTPAQRRPIMEAVLRLAESGT